MKKQRYSVIPRTLCFVFDKNKRLLLIKFSKDKGDMAGYFNPPGGHIEHGEGILENAEKEILEETGVQVSDTKLRGVVHASNFFNKNIMLFVTVSTVNDPKLVASKEGIPSWVKLNEINNLKLMDDIKVILEQLQKTPDNEVFTAKSSFDDEGNLLSFEVDN
ncbi:MAG: NUDIX domain-containing protein [Patescibacteria group bacterium]